MKKKKHILIAAYVTFVIIEVLFYVPYEKIEVFRSRQNVPHTEVIGSGYASIIEIEEEQAQIGSNREMSLGKRVDTSRLFVNLLFTTILFTAIYFLFISKKEKAEDVQPQKKHTFANYNVDEQIVLKKQNIRLQQTIDKLIDQNNKINLENESLRKQVIKLSKHF